MRPGGHRCELRRAFEGGWHWPLRKGNDSPSASGVPCGCERKRRFPRRVGWRAAPQRCTGLVFLAKPMKRKMMRCTNTVRRIAEMRRCGASKNTIGSQIHLINRLLAVGRRCRMSDEGYSSNDSRVLIVWKEARRVCALNNIFPYRSPANEIQAFVCFATAVVGFGVAARSLSAPPTGATPRFSTAPATTSVNRRSPKTSPRTSSASPM